MIEIETGSANDYADLGRADADEMLVKAQLASKIGDIIKRRKLTQAEDDGLSDETRPGYSHCRGASAASCKRGNREGGIRVGYPAITALPGWAFSNDSSQLPMSWGA
ncbi:MAG: XRE family transcriptional regulator [Methylocystis sp.]